MVCGPNVLAMTSPCDEENALDRLAAVLHAWEEQAVPPARRHTFCRPRARRGARSPKRCCARPIPCRWPMPQARQQRSTYGPTRPVCPMLAPGEEVTPEFLAACRELEAAGTRLKHIGGSGKMELRVMR